jgi:hypothetical protein
MCKAVVSILSGAFAVVGLLACGAETSTLDEASGAAPLESSCATNGYIGYLRSNNGAGYAASPTPGASIVAGKAVYAYPQNGGAWQVAEILTSAVSSTWPFIGNAAFLNSKYLNHAVFAYALESAPSFCLAHTSNGVELEECRPSGTTQMWVDEGTGESGARINVYATNASGGRKVLCDNGEHTRLSMVDPSQCSNAHQLWKLVCP